MPSRRLHLGIDCDGPLFGYVPALRRHLITYGHPASRMPRRPAHYSIGCCWGLEKEEVTRHILDGARTGLLLDGPVRPGAIRALSTLLQEGHRVSIVTARQLPNGEPEAERDTLTWLAREKVPHSDVVFTREKGIPGLDVLLDDLPKHCRQVNDAGGLGVLLRTSWNTEEHHGPLVSTSGFKDFLKIVHQIA